MSEADRRAQLIAHDARWERWLEGRFTAREWEWLSMGYRLPIPSSSPNYYGFLGDLPVVPDTETPKALVPGVIVGIRE